LGEVHLNHLYKIHEIIRPCDEFGLIPVIESYYREFLRNHKKMKNILLLLIGLITLSSCEWSGYYYFTIDNRSSHSVVVGVDPSYKYQYNKTTDSIRVVYPNNKILFWKDDGRNSGDRGNHFLIIFDTIYITPVDTALKLNKNFNEVENWIVTQHDKWKNGYFYYNFIINDSDISK
jgi:hypothetical protein